MQRHPDPAASAAALAPLPARAWLLGYAVYASFTALALLVGGEPSPLKAATAGALSALPELAAGPFTLRFLERQLRRRSPTLPWFWFVVAALAFIAWCLATGWIAPRFYYGASAAARPGGESVLVWRAAMACLVFSALAGLATARQRTGEAQAAALATERAERQRAAAELAALRAHLNPHFVLNVLHALVGLATREPARTAECLERLGALLRYGLRAQAEGRDLVPLAEELAITRQYLEIERLRLGDRLRVELAVDGEPQSAEVPPFSLQPLVENAIRHAVAPRAGGGRVTIEIREENGTLHLAVTDDGPAGEARPGEAGLGHSLLAERLRRLFGERAQLSAQALATGGFRAEVVITEGGGEG